MKRIFAAAIALAALGACGDGNPFTTTPTDDTDTDTTSIVPETISSTLVDFAFDAGAGTLTISGLQRDGDTNPITFNRRAALDRGPYAAFTLQDDPLDQHATVYVRDIGAVQGAVAATGGQFSFYSGGVQFSRTGAFDPITPSEGSDRGMVTYAGRYAGLTNLNGPRTDLLTPPAGVTDSTVLPSQAGVVTADIIINVEFDSNNVGGEIYNRVVESEAFGTVVDTDDLVFRPTALAEDGTFAGEVEIESQRGNDVGDYAGVIGGVESEALAGGIFVSEHFGPTGTLAGVNGEEEYGVFVLGRCGGPVADAGTAGCTGVDPE
jgi:hypothetical protein